MSTTTAPEAPSTDALRLWLDLVEDKLANDYDHGELHRLIVNCDIDPRLTGDSARAFAVLVQEVLSSGQLAALIEGGHFTSWDQEREALVPHPDRLTDPAARELYEYMSGDERFIAKARKERAESIKGRSVDPIANMIIGQLGHLPPEDRRDRIDVILAELREWLGA